METNRIETAGERLLGVDSPSLLLRADGHAGIGGGHVMRCLALAQAWRDTGGRAVFATAALAPALRQRLLNEGIPYFSVGGVPGSQGDALETIAIGERCSAAVAVIDGYHFDARFRGPLHAAGLATVAIDDNGEVGQCADDIIVNQNLHAAGDLYRYGEGRSKLLLGTAYALLRREFRHGIRTAGCKDGTVRNFLVTLGTADSGNVTSRVIAALKGLDLAGIEVRVVIGGESPHRTEIEAACSKLSNVHALRDPGTGMADLIAAADFAVTAGGSTMWELAAMGVPFVSVVTADNQRRAAAAMAAFGFPSVDAAHLEAELSGQLRKLVPDAPRRGALSDIGRRLVDSEGASRVCSEVFRLACAG
jgi:UDP-2,4-diacetamido-2,4,6-trideoxy-beta-L-altropyranose hydrolase